jgi:hypothetical protein
MFHESTVPSDSTLNTNEQMAEYYKTRPTVVAGRNVPGDEGVALSTQVPTLSEFDKHRETLLADDAEEGWASELRRYLKTLQQDVKKDTDIVGWWQVSYLCIKTFLLAKLIFPRTMLTYIRRLHTSHLMSSHLKHHLCHVNGFSRVPNKLPPTAERVWVQLSSKNSPS